MSCQKCRASLIDAGPGALPPELAGHLAKCAACSRFWSARQELAAAFASLAAETRTTPVPDLEPKVLSAWSAVPARPRRRAFWWAPVWSGALAVCLAAGAILLRQPAPQRAEGPFFRIPYVVPPAPYERIELVRADVPANVLAVAGVPAPESGANGMIRADVWIGQDGRLLAVRPVSRAIRRMNQ